MYEVEFTDDALDDLAKLSKDIGQRILKKIRWCSTGRYLTQLNLFVSRPPLLL